MSKKHDHDEKDKTEMPEAASAGETAPGADLAALQQELEQAKKQAAENLDGWKRSQAEFENYRKRLSKDLENDRLQTVSRVASRWIAVLDDLDRALGEKPAAEKFDTWFDGIQIIYRKGLNIFEQEGIASIEAEPGEAFNPALHEAVTMEPCSDRKDGEIIAVVRKGYKLGERVLRPAQVRVACAPQN